MTVEVMVKVSPEAESVAVGESAVSNANVPELDAVNKPIFATVTGSESDPLAVNVLVMV